MKHLFPRWPILSTALLAALLSAGALHAQAPATVKDGALVDAKGMTLYTFDKDAASKSNCNDRCAANWPPLQAAAEARGDADWSTFARDDGSKQWAYKGRPLYTWIKDTKPGEATGDGMGGIWHVAKP